MRSAAKVFGRETLAKFEDASASIPIRQLDRAFEGAGIRPARDPGEGGGARRTQFRRYLAGVDQDDPQQLARLSDALGTLVTEVATSKVDFLVKAAELDGFSFAGGAFRPAVTAPSSFAITRAEDLGSIDERGRRLQILANDDPKEALNGAAALADSVCRTVLRELGRPAPTKTAGLVAVVDAIVSALEQASKGGANAKERALVHGCLRQLASVVAGIGELCSSEESVERRNHKATGFPAPHARLAVGAATTLATFFAETVAPKHVPRA